MKRRWILALFLLLGVGCGLSCLLPHFSSQPKHQAMISIPQLQVSQTQLPNGINLLVHPDASSPVVSIQAWIKTGSITEEDYLGAGISHVLEHMVFKGTPTRGNSQIAHTLQELGGTINAYTSFDRTVFYVDLPSEGWRRALEVMADAVFNASIPEEEFAKEQEVIRREFAMGKDDPQRQLYHLLFRTAFRVHPYQHPVIGHLELFNQLNRFDIVAYHQRWYHPDAVTFVVTGNVSSQEVQDHLQSLTQTVARRTTPTPFVPAEPRQLSKREAHETFPTDVARLAISWHIPAVTHPDIYALDLLAIIAGQGDSSRLYRQLVERQKLARHVASFSYTPAEQGLWAVMAVQQPGVDRDTLHRAILKELDHLKTSEVSADELLKAQRQILASKLSELRTMSGRAAMIGNGHFLTGDPLFDQTYLSKIQQVTPAQIREVAVKYLQESTMTTVSLNPPTASSEVKPVEQKNVQRSVELITPKNSVPMVFVQDDKVPLVTVRASVLGGLLAEDSANHGIGQLHSRLLDKGTRRLNAEQIADEIELRGGALSVEYGNNSLSVAVEVLEQDLEFAVQLLSELILYPTFPQDEIDKERAKILADLKLQQDQPMMVARNALFAQVFGQHPYALNILGSEPVLEKLTRKDIERYHKERISNTSMVIAVGGSFDKGKAQSWIQHAFASVPKSDKAWQKPAEPVFPSETLKQLIPTPKQQAIVQIAFGGVDIAHPDRVALDILDSAMQDLGSRLFIRIREKQSLAYFVGSRNFVGLQKGAFIFYAGCAPEKSEQAWKEMLEEIRQTAREGLTVGEFERARSKLLGQKLLQDQSAPAVAFRSALNQLYGLGVQHDDVYVNRLRSITHSEVNAVAPKYWTTPYSVIVQPPLAK